MSAPVLIDGNSSETWASVLMAKHCGPLCGSDLSSLASFTVMLLPRPMLCATSCTPPNRLLKIDKKFSNCNLIHDFLDSLYPPHGGKDKCLKL